MAADSTCAAACRKSTSGGAKRSGGGREDGERPVDLVAPGDGHHRTGGGPVRAQRGRDVEAPVGEDVVGDDGGAVGERTAEEVAGVGRPDDRARHRAPKPAPARTTNRSPAERELGHECDGGPDRPADAADRVVQERPQVVRARGASTETGHQRLLLGAPRAVVLGGAPVADVAQQDRHTAVGGVDVDLPPVADLVAVAARVHGAPLGLRRGDGALERRPEHRGKHGQRVRADERLALRPLAVQPRDELHRAFVEERQAQVAVQPEQRVRHALEDRGGSALGLAQEGLLAERPRAGRARSSRCPSDARSPGRRRERRATRRAPARRRRSRAGRTAPSDAPRA